MNHTPYIDGRLFRCSACSWRAVLTTDQRLMQTQAGDSGHDHIGQAVAMRDAAMEGARRQAEAICDHLRQQYTLGEIGMDVAQYQRLIRCVLTEFSE